MNMQQLDFKGGPLIYLFPTSFSPSDSVLCLQSLVVLMHSDDRTSCVLVPFPLHLHPGSGRTRDTYKRGNISSNYRQHVASLIKVRKINKQNYQKLTIHHSKLSKMNKKFIVLFHVKWNTLLLKTWIWSDTSEECWAYDSRNEPQVSIHLCWWVCMASHLWSNSPTCAVLQALKCKNSKSII